MSIETYFSMHMGPISRLLSKNYSRTFIEIYSKKKWDFFLSVIETVKQTFCAYSNLITHVLDYILHLNKV